MMTTATRVRPVPTVGDFVLVCDASDYPVLKAGDLGKVVDYDWRDKEAFANGAVLVDLPRIEQDIVYHNVQF